jgi:hypothetical protein
MWIFISVIVCDSCCDFSIFFLIFFIKNNENKIKTRHQRIRKCNILSRRNISLVLAIDWISSSNNRASSIECGMHSSFSNSNSLLLHDLMNGYSIRLIHLIELIDTNDTSITKNHSTGFKLPLLGIIIPYNSSC